MKPTCRRDEGFSPKFLRFHPKGGRGITGSPANPERELQEHVRRYIRLIFPTTCHHETAYGNVERKLESTILHNRKDDIMIFTFDGTSRDSSTFRFRAQKEKKRLLSKYGCCGRKINGYLSCFTFIIMCSIKSTS